MASRSRHASMAARPRVPRRRADDRHALPAPAQYVIERPTEELHREILEGERRAVKQFHDPQIGVELNERSDGVVFEFPVSRRQDFGKRRFPDPVAHEGRDDTHRQLRVGQPRSARMSLASNCGHDSGRYSPPSPRQPGQQDIIEFEHRRAAAGTDITQFRSLDLCGGR